MIVAVNSKVERNQEIIRMARAGVPRQEIMTETGLSYSGVWCVLRDNGLVKSRNKVEVQFPVIMAYSLKAQAQVPVANMTLHQAANGAYSVKGDAAEGPATRLNRLVSKELAAELMALGMTVQD